MSWNGEQIIQTCPYIQEARNIIIVVPLDILRLLDELDKMFPDVEYSFYMKYNMKDNYMILHDIYVPRQTTSYVHVEVLEEVPLEYNVHIHKHPSGVHQFSAVDLQYSCANNAISLLHVYGEKGFSDIRIKKKLPCGHTALIKISTNNIIYYIDYKIDIEKVTEEFKKKVNTRALYAEYFDYTGYTGYRLNKKQKNIMIEMIEKYDPLNHVKKKTT